MKQLFIATISFCLLLSNPAMADTIRAAVASNFMAPMKEIVQSFEAQSEHKVLVSYGSSGKFYAQIQHGAPFDIFLSADSDKPLKLTEVNLADDSGRFTYAIGRLVLMSSQGGDAKQQLLDKQFKRLAIANPRLAPYGAAAHSALTSMGLWESAQPKLVMGENIAQTYQFVSSGNAQLGFIAASQIIDDGTLPASAWLIPESNHQTIAQDAVLLTRSTQKAAVDFLKFLRSDQAITIIQRYGYDTPSEQQ
ncbi:molybdate ABC transporter substrate-binding protein [Aurantivibrio plasticivorans]